MKQSQKNIHSDINHTKNRHSWESRNRRKDWIPGQARNHKLHRTYVVMYILAVTLMTLSILFGTTLMEPMMACGQPTERISISRESGRDPFILPPGVHLLTKGDTASKTHEVSSKDRAPSSLKINAILVSDHVRLASIDRHIVTVGDSIRDEKVLEIKNDRVILGKGDKTRILLLSQSPVQLTVEGK